MIEQAVPRLRLTGLTKTFPGARALDAVDIEVRPGEVHGLLGENGAGKSTLLNILSAVFAADAGSIEIDGAPVEITTPLKARAVGIAMIHQELQHVPHLTVAQNIFLGRPMRRLGGLLVDRRAQEARARRARRPRPDHRPCGADPHLARRTAADRRDRPRAHG